MKFYAVKKGRTTGIYNSWDECKKQVLGFENALFKSFDSYEEAESYMNKEALKEWDGSEADSLTVYAFTDGSFNQETGFFGYGGFLINGDEKYILQGNDTVYFGLMEPNSVFEQSLVRKSTNDCIKFDKDGNFFITIEPEDTEHLLPGIYYYSIKLEVDHLQGKTYESIHKVITVINKTKFIILD